jgi:hypothetical protein
MSYRVTIHGAKVVRNKLDKAEVLIGEGFDREAGHEMLDHLQDSMPPYPPELPGQRYVRTFNLRKALGSDIGGHKMSLSEVRAIGGEQVVILGLRGGTRDTYGPAVVGFTDQQREIHKGRWFTLLEHVEDQLGRLVKIVAKGTKRILRKAGF